MEPDPRPRSDLGDREPALTEEELRRIRELDRRDDAAIAKEVRERDARDTGERQTTAEVFGELGFDPKGPDDGH